MEALPTLILFFKGQVVERYVGYRSADELEKEVRVVSYFLINCLWLYCEVAYDENDNKNDNNSVNDDSDNNDENNSIIYIFFSFIAHYI